MIEVCLILNFIIKILICGFLRLLALILYYFFRSNFCIFYLTLAYTASPLVEFCFSRFNKFIQVFLISTKHFLVYYLDMPIRILFLFEHIMAYSTFIWIFFVYISMLFEILSVLELLSSDGAFMDFWNF